jgi:hypothetical protein
MKMKLICGFAVALGLLASCTETEFDKVTFPYTHVTGEYVMEFELPSLDITDQQHLWVFNTANSADSLWVEDHDFFQTQVRVKWDGNNKFSATNGVDILSGLSVDITGEVFPENDSIHVEWTYYDADIGLGEDDYVVTASGVRYNGITN